MMTSFPSTGGCAVQSLSPLHTFTLDYGDVDNDDDIAFYDNGDGDDQLCHPRDTIDDDNLTKG